MLMEVNDMWHRGHPLAYVVLLRFIFLNVAFNAIDNEYLKDAFILFVNTFIIQGRDKYLLECDFLLLETINHMKNLRYMKAIQSLNILNGQNSWLIYLKS